MDKYNTYESPLVSRYASREMLYLFSAQKKFSTWRRLWIALAKAEKELGLDISDEQIAEMEAFKDEINFETAENYERKLRHDVMAHIHAFGEQCPKAMPIIHLGATSCFAGDNTDIIIMREALTLIRDKLVILIEKLSAFAEKFKSMPTLGFTHFQPAQLTTVGKRASLWAFDFLADLEETEHRIAVLALRGTKGATGTQASFMELFGGDENKVLKLETLVCEYMGFEKAVPVSGQTYSRKTDYFVVSLLSGIAQSAGKFATDMRLLSHLKELEEPFEEAQIGSSAMPYKRNPMRCERICSLSRYILADTLNPAMTAYNQWLERTLDDSANKRIAVSEAFLAADSILNICINVASGIIVNDKVISKHIEEELPFMAAENIMMRAVSCGGDRQKLHERIRVHSMAAGNRVKKEGLSNDLIERISSDPLFGLEADEIRRELTPENFTGRAASQVECFLRDYVKPMLERQKKTYLNVEDLKV